MLRRLVTVTALASGMSVAAGLVLATPALAKGPSQASITGPGLARAIVVSGAGEPGQQGALATLAAATGLFTVMFGADNITLPQTPTPLRTSPPTASLGPVYSVVYTVPGVTAQPGEQYGQVRQDVYPFAAGGAVIFTPPGQQGFGGPLTVTGWLRASPGLARTLAGLGVPRHAVMPARPRAVHRTAAPHAGSLIPAWLIASGAAIAAAALAWTAFWVRRRRPQGGHESEPAPSGSAARSA